MNIMLSLNFTSTSLILVSLRPNGHALIYELSEKASHAGIVAPGWSKDVLHFISESNCHLII